jgi:hypothetical protein
MSANASLVPFSWAEGPVKELGIALVTSGVLGLTVDTFLKREFARDVFVAAFRYVLPDPLKEEVRRIMNYKILCEEALIVVKISIVDGADDLVKVDMNFERVFRNITQHSERMHGHFAVDEWGFPGHKSQITTCRLEANGKVLDPTDDPAYANRKDAVGKTTPEIPISPGKTSKSVAGGYEFHRQNGDLQIGFSNPTVNPLVRVEVPEGFGHFCTFGVPEERVRRSEITPEYHLEGTQFPGQHVRIRWWPAETEKTRE